MFVNLEAFLLKADAPNPERAEALWVEYRAGGPGAEAAFHTLLVWYGPKLYRHIWGFVRSDAAEDVFQDVLVKWHQHKHKLDTFAYAMRWLRTVAVRECIDAHRRRKRRSRCETKIGIAPDAAIPPDQRLDVEEAIAKALGKLSRNQREAIALVYFEGMDRQAAAAVLEVNRDTLSKWVEEALVRLREWLPYPAVAVAGGMLSIESVLSASPPEIRWHWLRDVASRAAAKAASSGHASHLALGIGLVMTGGIAVAGWQLTRDDPKMDHPPNRPPVADSRREKHESTPVETVSQRNLRLFKSEVLPKQLEALRGLAVGNGTVLLDKVEAFDVRIRCIYTLQHNNKDLPGWKSSLEFIHQTRNLDAGARHTGVYFSVFGEAARKPVDSKRAIILWRNPATGKEISLGCAQIQTAMAAFDLLPHDDLAETEFQAIWARIKAGAAPYLGVWYRQGNAGQRCEIRMTGNGWLHFLRPDVRFDDHRDRTYIGACRLSELDQSGRLIVQLDGKPLALSPDGRRLDIEQYHEWWSREPAPPR